MLHSRQDELMPLASTEHTVRSLQRQGVDIELNILEGITHFETYRFVDPLRETIPWIRRVWQI